MIQAVAGIFTTAITLVSLACRFPALRLLAHINSIFFHAFQISLHVIDYNLISILDQFSSGGQSIRQRFRILLLCSCLFHLVFLFVSYTTEDGKAITTNDYVILIIKGMNNKFMNFWDQEFARYYMKNLEYSKINPFLHKYYAHTYCAICQI